MEMEDFLNLVGGGGDNLQSKQYLPRNAKYSLTRKDERFPVENEGSIDLPLRILVPNEFIGAIIGRGGSTVRAVSKGTGARVEICRQGMCEKPVLITGAPEKASQACKKIMEIMTQDAMHQSGRHSHVDLALKIFIPNSVVGRIIGKGGAVIKQLMEDTQTMIHISTQPGYIDQNQSMNGYGHAHVWGWRSNQRLVTVRGSVEGMSQAEAAISSKLCEAYLEGKVRDRDLDFSILFGLF